MEIEKQQEYKRRLLQKIQDSQMTPEEYQLFLLQGIKKEIMKVKDLLKTIVVAEQITPRQEKYEEQGTKETEEYREW